MVPAETSISADTHAGALLDTAAGAPASGLAGLPALEPEPPGRRPALRPRMPTLVAVSRIPTRRWRRGSRWKCRAARGNSLPAGNDVKDPASPGKSED